MAGAPRRVLAIHTLLKDRFLKLGENADNFIALGADLCPADHPKRQGNPSFFRGLTRPVGGREQYVSMHNHIFGLHTQACMFFTSFEVKQVRSPFSL